MNHHKIIFFLTFFCILAVTATTANATATFSDQQIITTDAAVATSVYACDIDGDGDNDVLSASYGDDKIAWYENDGDGNFGSQQVITTAADGAECVYAIDIDGDGDNDVLSASLFDDKIAWYENTDGSGTFGTQQIITTNTDGARSVFSCDIDGDSHNDVLAAFPNANKMIWYQNTDGQGNFEIQQEITIPFVWDIYSCDIDNDSDKDILSASIDDKISWFENIDGQGNFGEQQVITTSADGAWSVYSSDIDSDGDNDVLSASYT
jgi:hypothetical protein